MSQGKAIAKYVRVPPRKARLAANLIRGKSVEKALSEMSFCKMKSGPYFVKLINSAAANAEVQFDARRDLLQIVEVRVDEGPSLKRAKPRSKGSRVPVTKRMSHFTVVVEEKKEVKEGS